MDDPNITMEEYIRLEEEKARKHGKVFNWKTAKYGRICTVDTAYSLNEYSVFDKGINMAYPGVWILRPSEGKSTNVGGEFTNIEILKCWSLEALRWLFNTQSCS
ncbi:hypothetical protein Tco_1277634 [Tanacetum coccineum]